MRNAPPRDKRGAKPIKKEGTSETPARGKWAKHAYTGTARAAAQALTDTTHASGNLASRIAGIARSTPAKPTTWKQTRTFKTVPTAAATAAVLEY